MKKKRRCCARLLISIIFICLFAPKANAESFFQFHVYMTDIFVNFKDIIADCGKIPEMHLYRIPKPQKSSIFEAMGDVKRSIAETSTCL